MQLSSQKIIILAVIEFFMALPLFYLIYPVPPGFARGYQPINYMSSQLLVFYGLMIVLGLQVFLASREIRDKKISSLLKQTALLGTVLFMMVIFFASQTAIQKLSSGQSIFYDDSKDCRYHVRTTPFYKLKPAERMPKGC